jgi:hypothetical protein
VFSLHCLQVEPYDHFDVVVIVALHLRVHLGVVEDT